MDFFDAVVTRRSIRKFSNQPVEKEYIASLLNVPAHLEAECIIAIGYPDEKKAPYRQDELPMDQVHQNTY